MNLTVRLLKWLAGGVAALVVLLYLVLPVGFAAYASLPHPVEVGPPPEGFSERSLETADGVGLAAWYAPSRNGAGVVLVHGATDSREGVRSHAAMLAREGFGVLAIDLRGHGESGGHGNAFSWEGTRDLQAAVAYLQAQDGVEAVGGLGLSLGGEVVLGALNATPSLRAVASEGATHRSVDEYLALPGREGLFGSGVIRLMYGCVGAFTGDRPPVPILESIRSAPDTRLFLIASGEKPEEVAYNSRFAEVAGDRADLWIVPGVGHTGGLSGKPDEYKTRVIGFFRSSLLADRA
jgi:pimeloyl-ACP methyl ester carboxylesterase